MIGSILAISLAASTAAVPEQPTSVDVEAALRLIRETFKTFCFADAETSDDPSVMSVVDTSKAP